MILGTLFKLTITRFAWHQRTAINKWPNCRLMACVQSSYLFFLCKACNAIDYSSFLHGNPLTRFPPGSSSFPKPSWSQSFNVNFSPLWSHFLELCSLDRANSAWRVFVHYQLASPLGTGAAVSVAGMMEMPCFPILHSSLLNTLRFPSLAFKRWARY